MITEIILFLLAFLNIGQYVTHFLERKDLYNRLMDRGIAEQFSRSRDMSDKALYKEKRPPPETAHGRVIGNWRKRGDKRGDADE